MTRYKMLFFTFACLLSLQLIGQKKKNLNSKSESSSKVISEEFLVYDTTIVFDPVTYEEHIKVTVSDGRIKREKVNVTFILSGEKVSYIDTILSLNTKSLNEEVEIVEWEVPVEINGLKSEVSFASWMRLENTVFSRKTLKLQIIAKECPKVIYFENGHPEIQLSLLNHKGKVAQRYHLEADQRRLNFGVLQLEPGTYKLQRSDTEEEIEIVII